jgi:hypothetical protein
VRAGAVNLAGSHDAFRLPTTIAPVASFAFVTSKSTKRPTLGRVFCKRPDLLRQTRRVRASHAAFCEFLSVAGRRYGAQRADMAAAIPRVLETRNVAVSRPMVEWGLDRMASGGDFADGQPQIGPNIVERAIRPQTITRKDPLFAGSFGGGRTWAAAFSRARWRRFSCLRSWALSLP